MSAFPSYDDRKIATENVSQKQKNLLTKMSDMTRRFEDILTSFSSNKGNGQVQVQN